MRAVPRFFSREHTPSARDVGKPGFPTPPPRRGMGEPGFPIPLRKGQALLNAPTGGGMGKLALPIPLRKGQALLNAPTGGGMGEPGSPMFTSGAGRLRRTVARGLWSLRNSYIPGWSWG